MEYLTQFFVEYFITIVEIVLQFHYHYNDFCAKTKLLAVNSPLACCELEQILVQVYTLTHIIYRLQV